MSSSDLDCADSMNPPTTDSAPKSPYNASGLQSLLGYGRDVHLRSGGVCQLCGYGAGSEVEFDLWRQFTIEHLIGRGQGGYPLQIRAAVNARFIHLSEQERRDVATRIHEANIVTACQFCNSTTSRDLASFTMQEVIAQLPPDPADAVAIVEEKLQTILLEKRARVQWKLESIFRVFQREIRPELLKRREDDPTLQDRSLRRLT